MLSFLIGIICILLHRPKKLTLVKAGVIFFKGKYQKYFDFENWNFVVFESIFNNKSYLDLSKVLQEKKVLKSNELTASPF